MKTLTRAPVDVAMNVVMWTVVLCVVIAGLASLTGCGTFTLGTSTPARGQSAEQHQLDRLACKDEAALAANTAGQQIVNGVLSATVLLEPIAFERQKSTQRATFSRCMTARGYTVTLP